MPRSWEFTHKWRALPGKFEVDVKGFHKGMFGVGHGGGLGDCPLLPKFIRFPTLEPMVKDLWMLLRAECKSKIGCPAALKLSNLS